MAHANTQLIEKAHEAFRRGDVQALFDMWTDDLVWHQAGNHPLAGDHRGKETVAAFLGGLRTHRRHVPGGVAACARRR